MDATLDQLKYPLGRWTWPETVAPGDIKAWTQEIAALPAQLHAAIAGLDDAQLDTPYRPEGWTVRQVVHHLADSHLNSQCRFRWALTEDEPTIKPYDQPAWGELPDSRTAPIEPSLLIIEGLHQRWVALANALTPEQWKRQFFHPEHSQPLRLDKTLAMYGWHGKHHVAHITRLRERSSW